MINKDCSMCLKTLSADLFSPKNHRCRPCQRQVNDLRNPERNYISQRAYNLAGYNGLNFYALPRDQRLKWREIARTLIDIGSTYGTAEQAQKRRRDGVIYVVSHPQMTGIKIGRAFDARSRLSNYNTGCPNREYRLEYVSPYVADVVDLEARVHGWADDYRLKGEWFSLPTETARIVITDLINSNKEKQYA